MTAAPITLRWKPTGNNGTICAEARREGQLLYTNKIDVTKATARDRFIADLAPICPDLPREDLAAELLRIAGELLQPANRPTDLPEVDISRIVRPELFHRQEGSGLSVAVVEMTTSGPAGRYMLYLRWADGRRERRQLGPTVELPEKGQLWVNPLPSPPSLTQSSGWSAESRRAWLSNEPTPSPAAVINELVKTLHYYLEFNPDTAEATAALLAAWVLFTYIHPAWTAVPYLSIGGPLGSGKSRVFEVLARTVFRPMASGNMTAPCLFRTLHETGGTLLLDEAERLRDQTPDAAELRSILLSGYKAGTPAKRLEPCGDGRFKTQSFDVCGPKAMAGIAQLPEALASRCIKIIMFRAGPDSPKPRRQIDEDPDRWSRLRDSLHFIALEHGATWLQLASRRDVCPMMSGRDFELWQPILSIAAWLEERGVSGLWKLLRGHAERVIEEASEDSIAEADEVLLRILADSLQNPHARPTCKWLLGEALARDQSTFAKNWTPRRVSNTLRRYGLKARKIGDGRIIEATSRDLLRIQVSYGIDLGMLALPIPETPSASSASSGYCPDSRTEADYPPEWDAVTEADATERGGV